MVILRSGSNTVGAAAPSHDSEDPNTAHTASASNNNNLGATGGADRRAASRQEERETRRGMPGEFSPSPTSPNPEPPEQSGEQEGVWASHRATGPAEKRIGDARGNPSQPCHSEERASEQASQPSEPHPSQLITPSFLADAEATPRDDDPAGSTTPFVTPSRKARAPVATQRPPLEGPRYFTNTLEIESGTLWEA